MVVTNDNSKSEKSKYSPMMFTINSINSNANSKCGFIHIYTAIAGSVVDFLFVNLAKESHSSSYYVRRRKTNTNKNNNNSNHSELNEMGIKLLNERRKQKKKFFYFTGKKTPMLLPKMEKIGKEFGCEREREKATRTLGRKETNQNIDKEEII